MQVLLGRHWHHLPSEEVVKLLESDPSFGLDLFDIRRRQERFGPNQLTPRRGKSPLIRFLLQFNNPLIIILLVTAVITAVVKDWVDAGIILAVVLVNTVLGFIQEYRAERAIEALAQAMTTEATVIRAGTTERVPASELVPGDLVSLKAGDKVPADLRLLRSRDLQIAEAALTGESVPVQKAADAELTVETALADRRNMAYASTLVTYGQGAGVVTATGDNTEVGRISELIASAEELTTPLTRKIARFSQILLYAILAVAAFTFLVGVLRRQPLIDTFTAAIALAVAAIPEGLPAALTVTLAIGVSRMARRCAIIRKMPAVEALGSTTIICSDKTGTLTQNQMTVQQIAVVGERYQVSGAGYEPEGQILDVQGQPLLPPSAKGAVRECLAAGLLCNDSALVRKEGAWQAQGDPTEVALLASGRKAGLTADLLNLPRLDTVPFESEHQYMATMHDAGSDQPRLVYVKGAVEVLLERCSKALDASGQWTTLDAQAIHRQADDMAAQGLRVLAFARGEMPAGTTMLAHADVAGGLIFLGLQGMIDPPRPEAVAAVQACQDAGIQIKMITGDHALTAAAIARQLGLRGVGEDGLDGPAVLSGREMASCCDEEVMDLVERTAVFARVSPEQKLRLVEAFQARNHIVAMTGDGVNDGPALKQADIGIAMGVSGTDVAKEAADMILIDDNFASIEAAVEEGRGVFDNLTKIIGWTLPTNVGEGLILLAAILAGVTLPILPVHILWINLVTVAALGLVLAVEPKESDIMRRPPRDPKAPILSPVMFWRVHLVGVLILVGAFGLFGWEMADGGSLAQARSVAVNLVVVVELFYLFNCRSLSQSMFRIGLLSNPWLFAGLGAIIVFQTIFTYLPVANQLFSSAPISLESWGRIVLYGLLTYLIVEAEKWLRRRAEEAS
jgi:cation-transporting P-type ATPase F